MNFIQKFFIVLAALSSAQLTKCEIVETPKQKTFKNENICNFQPNGAVIANPNDCHKFYICFQRKSYEYKCYDEYHYNAATRNCVKGPYCSSDYTTTCAEGNIRAVENDCYTLEACVKGQYEKINCPPNYYFNAPKGFCMPYKYDAEFMCNCLMPEYTVLENEDNCAAYFVCHGKSAILENCPLGQYYNAELNTCLTDLKGDCLIKPMITTGPLKDKVENYAQTLCYNFGLKGIHFQTLPKSCNEFYVCINGQLYTQHCPPYFYYDGNKNYCVFDATKKCGDAENLFNTHS